jgi:cytochrome o ubiquinol oxidase subunit 3
MSKVASAATRSEEHPSLAPFGFWLYLMTDCILFGALFATFIVLRGGAFNVPAGEELFNMPFVLAETVILLTSSFVCGMAVLAARAKNIQGTTIALLGTVVLGLVFLGMEISEFVSLAAEGESWSASAFMSAFFTLVGTHGLHILTGLMWASALVWYLAKKGMTNNFTKKLGLFAMFWHFLDVVWIFIFTIVYLMGVV